MCHGLYDARSGVRPARLTGVSAALGIVETMESERRLYTDAEIDAIRRRHEGGQSYAEIADAIGCSRLYVYRVLRGDTAKDRGRRGDDG